jgi:hypothetical protein
VKSWMLINGVVLAVLLAWGTHLGVMGQAQGSPGAPEREPVVVELFTSEGCSSCPPADALLSALDKLQPFGIAHIIAIEEHVDYWDQQGWKDPFSSASWTARQAEYVGPLHTGNPYTPQIVVDGEAGFVGSNSALARRDIEKEAASSKAKVEISEVSPVENRSATFKISVEKLRSSTPKDTPEVVLALTESGLHSSVKAGENEGKELSHSPVLRELKVIGVVGKNGQDSFTGQQAVKLDSKWNVQNLRAVAFVQEKKSRHILGAAEVRLAQ